jgi:DNA-binding NarL/FixJ family response regulator
VAIFILDIYLNEKTAFDILEEISSKYAWAPEDTIIISGNASDDIVNMCIAANINYLIEKPMKVYTLIFAVRAIVGKYTLFAKSDTTMNVSSFIFTTSLNSIMVGN